jgi:hypothetical protein
VEGIRQATPGEWRGGKPSRHPITTWIYSGTTTPPPTQPHTTDRASVISNDKNHARDYTKNYNDVIFNDPEHVENYTLGKSSANKHGRNNERNYTKLIQ